MIFEALDLMITPVNYEEHIKRIESYVRNSKEYKAYLAYVYNKFKFIKPDLLKLNDLKSVEVDTDYHHVITLYSLVGMTIMKYFTENNVFQVSVWKIVELVINLHLEDELVGVILASNLHQMYHAGLYELYEGMSGLHIGSNVNKFINDYKDFMSSEELDLLIKLGVNYEKEND